MVDKQDGDGLWMGGAQAIDPTTCLQDNITVLWQIEEDDIVAVLMERQSERAGGKRAQEHLDAGIGRVELLGDLGTLLRSHGRTDRDHVGVQEGEILLDNERD